MIEIVLSHKYFAKMLKLGWHSAMYEDVPGIPAYNDEKQGHALTFIEEGSGDEAVRYGTKVKIKPSLAVLYLSEKQAKPRAERPTATKKKSYEKE